MFLLDFSDGVLKNIMNVVMIIPIQIMDKIDNNPINTANSLYVA